MSKKTNDQEKELPVTAQPAAETEIAQAQPVQEEEMSAIEAASMRTLSPARIVLKRFFRSKLRSEEHTSELQSQSSQM